MRLLHIEADELILLGLREAVPEGWDVTSVRLCAVNERLLLGETWAACVLGIGDGPEAAREALSCLLHLDRHGCPLLVWLPVSAAQYIPAMKALGVSGFVSRAASFEELLTGIGDVVAGGIFIDHRLRPGLPDERDTACDLPLTDAQQRVAALYVLHGNRRLVARDLHVSENTVKYHLRLIYAKTGTSSVHELHQLLLARGWTPPESR